MRSDRELCAALDRALREGRVDPDLRARLEALADGEAAAGDAIPPTTSAWFESPELLGLLASMPAGLARLSIDADGELWVDRATPWLVQLGGGDGCLPARGARVASALRHDDYPILYETLAAACIDGSPVEADLRVVDLHERTLWLRMSVVFDGPATEHGARMLAAFREITHIKQASEALARSDAGFRALLRSTRWAFLMLDLDHCVVAYNDLVFNDATAIRWKTPEVGRSIFEVASEDFLAHYADALPSVLGGQAIEIRVPVLTTRGNRRVFDLVIAPVHRPGGELFAIAVSSNDVTRPVQAERAVAESDRILARLPLAVLTVSPDGQIRRWRAAAVSILGRESKDVVGQPLSSLLSEAAGRTTLPGIEAAVRAGHRYRVDAEGVRGDGSTVPLEVTVCPPAGDDDDRIVLIEDVTIRQALQRQLVESHKMEAVGLFAAGVAHDFNNLLAAIVGHTAMLDLDMAPDDPRRVELQGIEATAERAASLARSLLGLARQRHDADRTVDAVALVADMMPMLTRLAGPQCAVTFDRRVETFAVRIDPIQLEQIVINLVVNARDAMGGQGRVELRMDAVDLDVEAARARSMLPGPTCRIEARDRGLGIESALLERVFEPFFSTKPAGRGTGLGLSICRQIVRSRGGEIEIASTLGEGSTVSLWLPRSPEAADDRAAPRGIDRLEGGTERLLLVEDAAELRAIWARLLERLGYDVAVAGDGDEARHLLDRPRRFDMLITDVVMPRLGGLDLARLFRHSHPDHPILFVSGQASTELKQVHLDELDAILLPKPFDGPTLARRIRALFDTACS